MIIVEGCDNSGKSTLVQRLSGDLKLLTVNNRQRPRSLDESFDYLYRLVPLITKFNTIFDRWQPISEPIYGPICRKTSIFQQADIIKQHRWLRDLKVNPIIIYCRPSDAHILDFGTREQMTGVIENAPALIREYDSMMDWLAQCWFPVINYDYEYCSYDDLKEQVLDLQQGKL